MKKEINEEIIEIIKNELDLKEKEKEIILNNKEIFARIYDLGYHKGRIECFDLIFEKKKLNI